MSHLDRVRARQQQGRNWSDRRIDGLKPPTLSLIARKARRHRLLVLKLAGGR